MSKYNRLVINGETQENIYIGQGYTYKGADVAIVTSDILGRNSSIYKRTEVKGFEDSIPIVITNKDGLSYDEIIDYVVSKTKMGSKEALQIGFTDVEYYRIGYFKGLLEVETDDESLEGYQLELQVLYTDPYKYSKEEEVKVFSDDKVIVSNKYEEKYPIIRLLAMTNQTHLNILNTQTKEIFKLGTEIEGYKSSDSGLINIGQSNLDDWSTYTGKNKLKTNRGTIKVESGVFKPDTFDNRLGTGQVEQSGIVHDLSSNIYRDFNLTAMFRTRDVAPNKYGKASVFLVDDEGNEILELSLTLNNTHSNSRMRGKVAVGFDAMLEGTPIKYQKLMDFTGDNYGRSYEDSDVFIKLERRGYEYTLRTWIYHQVTKKSTSRHVARWSNLGGGIKSSDISKVVVSFGKKVGTSLVELGIGQIRLEDVKDELAGNYEIQQGDEIIVDSETDRVTINGEVVTRLKDPASDFLTLYKGINTLETYPRRGYYAEIYSRDRKI